MKAEVLEEASRKKRWYFEFTEHDAIRSVKSELALLILGMCVNGYDKKVGVVTILLL